MNAICIKQLTSFQTYSNTKCTLGEMEQNVLPYWYFVLSIRYMVPKYSWTFIT